MKLPSAQVADELFENRMLFIMGAGRSGTTILGTLIASMHPVFYLFEPVLLRLFPLFVRTKPHPAFEQALKSVLLEDFLLPLCHGRRIDPYKADMTYWGNYIDLPMLLWRGKTMRTRNDSISWATVEKPLWAIKHPEFQALAPTAARLFPGACFLHIIRNGNDVVASAMTRSWYGDEWCHHIGVEWTVGDHGCPWYLSAESRECWPKWDAQTRAACVWRTATRLGMDYSDGNPNCYQLRYESDLCKEPLAVAKTMALELNVRVTEQTKECIKSIEEFQGREYEPVAIQDPECHKFEALMKELGYK